MAEIHPITMPKWGLAMTEGTVAVWNVAEGQEVRPGTEVLDIETSKITNALETEASGVLRRRIAAEGDVLPVGALIGVIADPGLPDAELDAFIAAFQAQAAATGASEAAAPEPQTVTVDGRTIRYLTMGAGGTPILFIHGFGGDLNNWLFNQPALAEHHATYAIDLPGHGGSAKQVGDGSVKDLAAVVAGFMAATGLARAHLVGHSLGGSIALMLALQHPDRVASLTLIASGGLGREINRPFIDGYITADRRKELKPVLEKLFADPDLVTRDLVEDVLKFKRLDGVTQALKTIAGSTFADGVQAGTFRDRLGQIRVPIQVIWGEADAIIPAAHAQGLPSGIAVHVFDGKGHMAHMEAATEVNRLIEEMAGRA